MQRIQLLLKFLNAEFVVGGSLCYSHEWPRWYSTVAEYDASLHMDADILHSPSQGKKCQSVTFTQFM